MCVRVVVGQVNISDTTVHNAEIVTTTMNSNPHETAEERMEPRETQISSNDRNLYPEYTHECAHTDLLVGSN